MGQRPSERVWEAVLADRAAGREDSLLDHLRPGRHGLTLADVAARSRAGEPFPVVVRDFLDDWRFAGDDAERRRRLEPEPESTGDGRHDAYLGAVAEHLAARNELPAPSWSREPGRFLDTFWWPTSTTALHALALVQSPAAFRRRGIFIGATTLDRV